MATLLACHLLPKLTYAAKYGKAHDGVIGDDGCSPTVSNKSVIMAVTVRVNVIHS